MQWPSAVPKVRLPILLHPTFQPYLWKANVPFILLTAPRYWQSSLSFLLLLPARTLRLSGKPAMSSCFPLHVSVCLAMQFTRLRYPVRCSCIWRAWVVLSSTRMHGSHSQEKSFFLSCQHGWVGSRFSSSTLYINRAHSKHYLVVFWETFGYYCFCECYCGFFGWLCSCTTV